VELLRFEATPRAGMVDLNWETAAERQHSHFEVERSADAQSWETLGRVYPARAGQEGQTYAFADQQPLEGRNLYRLRQVDLDGQFAYSHTVEAWSQVQAQAWPNPFGDRLELRMAPAEAASQLLIFDLTGRQVARETIAPGTSALSLDLSTLPAGAYMARLQSPSGTQLIPLRKQ
ncbi:MAG: T9SS C-terminal target domain-containing protein, partial [Bacteroidetes bacterium]